MPRVGFTLAVFLAASVWAGAQGPVPASLSAADRVRLLRTNRVLVAELVDDGVKLAAADHPVERADSCRNTARALGAALRQAAEAQDADRVAELGSHLEVMVREGLVPILNDARQTIPPQSPDAVRLKAVREAASGDLTLVQSAIPMTGKLGDSAQVREVVGRLDALKEKLK